MYKWMMTSGAVFSLLSVVLGAFAAHGLKAQISEHYLSVFQTGVHYQAIHGIGLLLCGLFAFQISRETKAPTFWLKLTALSFSFGILFFSGSLYALAITQIKWFGPVTPLGGLFFIAGWCCFIIAIVKSERV